MAQMSKFGLAVDSHLKDMQGCGAMCSETTARGSDGFGWFGVEGWTYISGGLRRCNESPQSIRRMTAYIRCNSWEEGDSLSVSLDSYDPC